MFGHQDENDNNQAPAEPQADATLAGGDSAPAIEEHEVDEALKALAAHATDDEAASAPSIDTTPPVITGSAPEPAEASDSTRAVADPGRSDAPSDNPDASKLLSLKQDALQQLTPLLDKLDQTPDEKFRTTMMMIQAADNQALLPNAYAAAQAIPDEKAKAQALLDIVNEINYFTQQTEA